MAALNCYACHLRGDVGGPEASRDSHFQTTTPEMGLEGRLPPPLDRVGDKLNDTYMATLLANGGNLRAYMGTRMPGYQYEPLRAFHESINRLDRKLDVEPVENDQPHEVIVAAGRQAVGNRGLACIKCHSFGGNKGGGIGAIDMLKMNERLRFEWFHRYLQNPTLYRPGTRMPNSFVDGRSALTDLYDGDPAMQIDAIWQYLALGDQAPEPEGLKEGAILLTATDRPRIYRNFFQEVSGRGIAVGYPENINLIWDAERMGLARIWKNSFIDASMHWRNRGQGRQQPLGDAVVDIEQVTPFALLTSPDAEWPAESGRDRGYRFRGYRLDQGGRPTFRYTIGDVTIQETPRPTEDGNAKLVREIVVERPVADQATLLVWQPAKGKIEPLQDGYAIDGRYELTIDGVDCELHGNGDSQTLRAVVPTGVTRITETIRW